MDRLKDDFRNGQALAGLTADQLNTTAKWLNNLEFVGGVVEHDPERIRITPVNPGGVDITDYPWRIRSIDATNLTISKGPWTRNGGTVDTGETEAGSGVFQFAYREDPIGTGTMAVGEDWALVAFLTNAGKPVSTDPDAITCKFIYLPDCPTISSEVGAEVIAILRIGEDGNPYLPIPQRIRQDIVDEVPEGEWAVSVASDDFTTAKIAIPSGSTWERNGGSLTPTETTLDLEEGRSYIYAWRYDASGLDPSICGSELHLDKSDSPPSNNTMEGIYALVAVVDVESMNGSLMVTRIIQCRVGRIYDFWAIPDGDDALPEGSPRRKTLERAPSGGPAINALQMYNSETAEKSATCIPVLPVDSDGDGELEWPALDTMREGPLGKSLEAVNVGTENQAYIQLKGFYHADSLGRSLANGDTVVLRTGDSVPEIVYVPYDQFTGLQGPAGPAGADGNDGGEGPTGPQGPPGTTEHRGLTDIQNQTYDDDHRGNRTPIAGPAYGPAYLASSGDAARNSMTGVIGDSSNTTSIDPANRALMKGGKKIVDYGTGMAINDASETKAFDIANRTINDASGNVSVDAKNRQLQGPQGAITLDWTAQHTLTSCGVDLYAIPQMSSFSPTDYATDSAPNGTLNTMLGSICNQLQQLGPLLNEVLTALQEYKVISTP